MMLYGYKEQVYNGGDIVAFEKPGARLTGTRPPGYMITAAKLFAKTWTKPYDPDLLVLGYGLGYGTKAIFEALEPRVPQTVAVDLSPDLVGHDRAAHKVYEPMKDMLIFVEHAVTYVRDRRSPFDFIVVDLFQDGLDVPEEFIQEGFVSELARLLRPGGLIYWHILDYGQSLDVMGQDAGLTLIKGGWDYNDVVLERPEVVDE